MITIKIPNPRRIFSIVSEKGIIEKNNTIIGKRTIIDGKILARISYGVKMFNPSINKKV
jgi:hypothetical protein